MAVRIKRHWFQDERVRPAEEQASVIAVAAWKSATHGLQGLRKAKFGVDVGDPFVDVLGEFLAFLVTIADRMAYLHGPAAADDPDQAAEAAQSADRADESGGDWRNRFTVALAKRLATIYQENLDELIGPSVANDGHRGVFIELLNRRMAEYADFDYAEDGPEFAMLRYFGRCIEQTLPDPADRRWVLDQIMASQAPEAIETVERGMRGILGLDPKPRPKPEGVAASG